VKTKVPSYERAISHAHSLQGDMDKLAKMGVFNPAYRDCSKRCWDEAVSEATAEEAGVNWSRPFRAARRREIYDAKMAAEAAK